jgi:hypothetical protein
MNERRQYPIAGWLIETLLRRMGRGTRAPSPEPLAQIVEELRSTNLARRVAAIGALDPIARDNGGDHWLAIEALTSFLRHRAPWPAGEPEIGRQERADIQAAMSVLGRRTLAPPRRRRRTASTCAMSICAESG